MPTMKADANFSKKLVACYAIGWNITQDELDAYTGLEFAKGETDTGVIISFNSEAEYVDDKRGALKVTDVSAEKCPPVLDIFQEGVYHLYDYQFFYRNLEKNVQIRIDAFAKGK